MGVKLGFKQTEAGLIPDDWKVLPVGCLATTVASGRSSAGKGTAAYPVYGSTGIIGFTSNPEYDGDAILVARVGANAGRVNFVSGKYGVTDNTIILRLRSNCSLAFVWRLLEAKRLNRLVFGSGQPLITGTQIKALGLALPPFPEQTAIATALSDVDALLNGLDRLIAKKRDIKQAAMQQLLTGQTRLPGFRGNWKLQLLGDVAHIKTGSRNNEDKIEDGEYPFFVRSENIERINSYSYDCEAILVPGEGRIGEIFHYVNGRFDVHQRVYAITRFDPAMSAKFIYLYMTMHFGPWALQNSVKATVDSLRLPTFQTFQMRVPPTNAEQTAIALVLTDINAELEALESRRNKTYDLKQAMMQELLTGRTRLVAVEDTDG
jgi:type I restriction enzyme S subunit